MHLIFPALWSKHWDPLYSRSRPSRLCNRLGFVAGVVGRLAHLGLAWQSWRQAPRERHRPALYGSGQCVVRIVYYAL